MKAIIKSILVLTFLIFSTSSFAGSFCEARGSDHKGIYIPKEGYAKYEDVQPYLSEDNVYGIAEATIGGMKKIALENLQDRKDDKEDKLRKNCPNGFEAKIEWSNAREYKSYSVGVDVEGKDYKNGCYVWYSNGETLAELEKCLKEKNKLETDYELSFLSVEARIDLSVRYVANCEVQCVPNENQSDNDEGHSEPYDERY